jgi:hypothetical protein
MTESGAMAQPDWIAAGLSCRMLDDIIVPARDEWPSGARLRERQPAQPFDIVRPIIPWDEQTRGKAVFGRQRLTIELIGDQNITLAEPLQRQVLGVSVARNACESAVVETTRPQVPRLAINPKAIKQRRKIRAAPPHIGDAARRHLRFERIAAALMHGLEDFFLVALSVARG